MTISPAVVWRLLQVGAVAALVIFAYQRGDASRDDEVDALVAQIAASNAEATAQAQLAVTRAADARRALARYRAATKPRKETIDAVLAKPQQGTDTDKAVAVLADYLAASRRLRNTDDASRTGVDPVPTP